MKIVTITNSRCLSSGRILADERLAVAQIQFNRFALRELDIFMVTRVRHQGSQKAAVIHGSKGESVAEAAP